MIEFFQNNYEWIFSGIGVFVIGGLLTFLKKSKLKKAKTNNQIVRITDVNDSNVQIIQSQNITNNNVVNNLSKEKEISIEQHTLKLPPNKIMEEIKNLPPYQLDEGIKHYVGMHVSWEVEFYSIPTKKNNIISVMSLYNGNYPWIYFDIDIIEFPYFKIAKRKEKFIVKGEIFKVEIGGITLKIRNITNLDDKT